jgi:hypothetical protein
MAPNAKRSNIEITEEKLEEEDRHIKSLNLLLHNEGTSTHS